MKIAVYLDEVSNSIDNAMQWAIMRRISENLHDHELLIIDPLGIGKEEAMRVLMQQDYDVLLTYNKTGTDLKVRLDGGDETSLLSAINRKHVAWLTEHPLTFYDQYMSSQCDRHFIFPNESHAFFAESMGLRGSFSTQMFGSSPAKTIAPFMAREFDVCIAAQWRGTADVNAFWKTMTGKTREFFEDVLYLQDTIETRDTFTAFLAAAKHHGMDEGEVLQAGSAMRAIYWYARKKERIKLVQDFASSGLKVALIGGEDWKEVLPNHDNIFFAEPVGHEHLKNWYQNSKSVVTMNNFHGANERVFDAMAAGCLVFGECAPSLVSILGEKNAVFYEPNKACDKLDELEQLIRTGSAQAMAQSGTHRFSTEHTWQHRGEYLSALLDELMNIEKA
ncbi:glycosyltransferase [Limnohabitans sp. DCL3]|uniref:glycosyltransferase family protein n=1 Tax=Limnohabitans sp. DCL3 TaxID=3374103 RepID=UPI003A8ACAF9